MKIKLDTIKNNPGNPRHISTDKMKDLVKSLKDFPKMMELRPIIVDDDNIILGGNMRFLALKELGFEDIPGEWVKRASDLTDEQKREFIVKDNLPFGEWDMDVLANEWDELQLLDWGMDISGWDKPDPQPDNYQEPEEVKTDIKTGDLFQIGDHRLMCGDSTDEKNIAKLTGDAQPEIVFTDPPYSSGGFQETGKTSGSIGKRHGQKIATDNLSTRGYTALMKSVLANCQSAHSIFVFCDWKMWMYNVDISEAKGFRVRNMIVWDKMRMGMGMPFRNQHELCLFGSKIAGKIGDGKTPNVLQYERDTEAEHATPKPVGLIGRLLNQIEGQNIIDPFIGGGSTMVAAHQLNRNCYGMELDPKYCQITIDRMQKLDPTIKVKKL